MTDKARNFGQALSAIDEVWSELAQFPLIAQELGKSSDRLPSISPDAVAKHSAKARDLLARLDGLDAEGLPFDLGLTLRVARYHATAWAREEEYYWLLCDPMGNGFYSLFLPTAYAGGWMISRLTSEFVRTQFGSPGDADRYIGKLHDLARLIGEMDARTRGQAERGIYMPRAQLAASIKLMQELKVSLNAALRPAPERLMALDVTGLAARIDTVVEASVLPALDALIAFLEDAAYAAAAPEAVGLSQYPGGRAIYEQLVKLHTTLDLTPEEAHRIGLERIASIETSMQRLFDEIGFAGTPQDYLQKIAGDPAWRAEGPEALGAFFRHYIDRIAPHIAEQFRFAPVAGHDVAPLPDALTGSMTFGYYSRPQPGQEEGLYLFNSPNLSAGPLPNVAALNYHELVPGHHFHFASQRENQALHPLRQNTFINAYNEGWAEYAATLAGEMGMYAAPEEQFGRMMQDSFLTCRLVVDTGMNALGWSLEQARDYMREHSFMPETEIQSESIRYSCGMPAQSLAYKLGDTFLLEQREKMRGKLGDRFDIRDFHDSVLKPGSLPLSLLADHLDGETERLLQDS
jgi:uncharacterized protein (DUF885 family)